MFWSTSQQAQGHPGAVDGRPATVAPTTGPSPQDLLVLITNRGSVPVAITGDPNNFAEVAVATSAAPVTRARTLHYVLDGVPAHSSRWVRVRGPSGCVEAGASQSMGALTVVERLRWTRRTVMLPFPQLVDITGATAANVPLCTSGGAGAGNWPPPVSAAPTS
jgi:hypothetical protein